MIEKIIIAFLFLFLFLLVFLALHRVIKNTKWTCFVATAVSCLPFILLWEHRTNFLERKPVNSPNVIILLVDCLRADHLRSYGYGRKTSPNIDRFAKDSVMFTQAISQSTFTKTSVASLFTSLYPYQHGVYEGNLSDTKAHITSDVLGEEKTTLSEALSQNGFLTMAWVKNEQMRSFMGFAQGFVKYDEPAGRAKRINKKFLKWISESGKKHKFFAYIHYIDLHDPYRPKPPYDTMYGVYSEDIYSDIDRRMWGYHLRAIRDGKRKLEKKDVEQLKAYYDGLITYTDKQIGLVLKKLKKLDLYDNSLIIITADHGEGFMEHGFISHSTTPYDELIRVPLIIKFPNSLYGGKVVKSQVRLIDVMPTILDFLRIKIDSKLEGLSLLNSLDDNEDNKIDFPKYAYSEAATGIAIGDQGYPTISVRTEEFKYIHFQNKQDEFYDLRTDPKEQNNIIGLRAGEAEKFRKMALGAVLKRRELDKQRVTLDKKTIQDLKALGYIQ